MAGALMPAEYVLITVERPEPRVIARAVASTDPLLTHRTQRDGQHLVLSDGDSIVVTIVHPRPVEVASEIERLLTMRADTMSGSRWWTDAIVPFGQQNRAEEVLAALAALLDGNLCRHPSPTTSSRE